MKKNCIYTFIIAIGLILSACGSNSKPDGIGGDNASGKIITSLQKITIDRTNGNIVADINVSSTYTDKVVATLNHMDLTLGGCPLVKGSLLVNPSEVILTSASPSANVSLNGKMVDPTCTPTSYQLSGNNALLVNGKTVTEVFTAVRGTIDPTSIIEETLKTVLTVIDPVNKILDINISGIQKGITVHLAQGVTNVSGKKIKITTNNIESGSFFTSLQETNSLGNAIFAYTAPVQIINKQFNVEFCLEEDTSICDTASIKLTTGNVIDNNDTNTTPDVGNDFINYGLKFMTNDGKNILGLDERKVFVVSLIDKDTNEIIAPNQVEKITIESKKPDVIKLIDPSDAIGTAVAKLEILGKNSINVYLKASKDISGLSDITVTINYKNKKGYKRVLSGTYAITVLSGPPTAFSINSAGVSYNKVTKWFENEFLISASDKYNNPINTSPTISVSVMAGYAKDNSGNRIIYGQHSKAAGISGNVNVADNAVTLNSVGVSPFNDFSIDTLRGVDIDRDVVAIFGNVRTYEANGKWEIQNIDDTSHLSLKDVYNGKSYTGVGFAIGHNYREDLCSSDYREWQTKVDSTDGSYQLDEEGKTFVTVKFPAEFMVGKKVALMVNFIGQNPETGKQLRGGEVKFVTLHSFEGIHGRLVPVTKGTSKIVRLWGVIDTGTEDRWALHNSLFSCNTVDSANISINSITRNDPNSCIQPYIEYNVTTTNNGEDGSFVLSDCQVDNEFSF